MKTLQKKKPQSRKKTSAVHGGTQIHIQLHYPENNLTLPDGSCSLIRCGSIASFYLGAPP
jgi:hypothetical protein